MAPFLGPDIGSFSFILSQGDGAASGLILWPPVYPATSA